jgi:hypothetical protein
MPVHGLSWKSPTASPMMPAVTAVVEPNRFWIVLRTHDLAHGPSPQADLVNVLAQGRRFLVLADTRHRSVPSCRDCLQAFGLKNILCHGYELP